MNFGVKSSIKEKPRCAGKTGTVEHPPSASNVRLRFVKPESESLDIRQTRIQVPGVEYSICRSLANNEPCFANKTLSKIDETNEPFVEGEFF